MKFKAALFDLDGTLLDSVPIILMAARKTFEIMELPFDEHEVRVSIGIPLSVQARDWAGPRATEFEDRYRTLYRHHQYQDLRLFPGTIEMLSGLKASGVLTGIVTSKAAQGTAHTLERTGMGRLFDAVISAEDAARPKPHPDPILKALEMLGVPPSSAIYVGDSAFDIDCARSAGVVPAAMTWGARTRDELLPLCPGHVFDTWPEFVACLE